jgi:hypothetical protein
MLSLGTMRSIAIMFAFALSGLACGSDISSPPEHPRSQARSLEEWDCVIEAEAKCNGDPACEWEDYADCVAHLP